MLTRTHGSRPQGQNQKRDPQIQVKGHDHFKAWTKDHTLRAKTRTKNFRLKAKDRNKGQTLEAKVRTNSSRLFYCYYIIYEQIRNNVHRNAIEFTGPYERHWLDPKGKCSVHSP